MLQRQRISYVDEDTTLDVVVEQLVNNCVDFVLVKNKTGVPIGSIHLFDIVKLCCQNYLKWNDCYGFCFRMKLEFSETTVKQVIDSKQWFTVNLIAPLSDLDRLLSMPNVDDVGILGEDPKEILWLATRSDLIQFLYQNRTLINGVMSKKIKECEMNKVSDCITKSEFAIEAFQLLWAKQKNGFCVSHGKTPLDKFLTLILQIMVYPQEDVSILSGHCVLYPEDSLQKVLECIGPRCLQRVFVYDDRHRGKVADVPIHNIVAQFRNCL